WTGTGAGVVEQVNPSNGAVGVMASGQTNVNGITVTDLIVSGISQRYVWAANSEFVCKINATTGAYQTISAGNAAYRICTDGTYIYAADYGEAAVYKYLASTGQ